MHIRFVEIAALVASFAVVPAAARAQTAADTGHKSPVLAGVASYFLPGVGSWYAGNVHHAQVHGGIAIGLGVVAVGLGLAGDCLDLGCKDETANALLGFVVLGGLTNSIWATVTAVRDAHAYNDRTERLRTGHLEIAPAFRLARSPGDAARWRVEMRVVHLEF